MLGLAGHEVIRVRRENAGGSRAVAQLAMYAFDPIGTPRLMRLARRRRPQVAHFHNTWFATSPQVLRQLKSIGIPTVVTVHNYRLACVNAQLLKDGKPCELCVGRVPWRGVRYRCYHDSVGQSAAAAIGIQAHRTLGTWSRGVDRFIALSEFSRDQLIASGLPAERIVVRPNFVPDPGPRPRSPSASRIVAFVGRLSPEKGLDVAIRAWERARLSGLELVVAGDGPQRRQLEALAGPSVRFVGRVDAETVMRLLQSSRAVLLPSIWFESQPLGALEAFAAGIPAMGSAIGGLGETIAPIGDAWLVPAADEDAWAEKLRALADDRLVDIAGAAARDLYESRHSPERARRSLEEVYDDVVAAAESGGFR
jgi:glycosyltransferase involved in cell wall biosynthesis